MKALRAYFEYHTGSGRAVAPPGVDAFRAILVDLDASIAAGDDAAARRHVERVYQSVWWAWTEGIAHAAEGLLLRSEALDALASVS